METTNLMAAEFLAYNRWANLRLMDALLELSPDQLDCELAGTYGSIYNTLVHMVKAEAGYYRRTTGNTLKPPFSWENSPTVAEIRAFAEQVSSAFMEAAGQMQYSDTFHRDWNDDYWEGAPENFRMVGLLIQAVDHGIEHRTNITTIMANQGIPVPEMDGWEYMRMNVDRMADI